MRRDDVIAMVASTRMCQLKTLQDRIIDAVEKANSAKLATYNASYGYRIGYAEAKRDVLIEIAQVFAEVSSSDEQLAQAWANDTCLAGSDSWRVAYESYLAALRMVFP